MRRGILVGLGLFVAACGGGSTTDAGAALDAGGDDAGPMSVDAGPVSVDAGSDAGPMSVDAGSDAGPMSVDAGADAGPMVADAGPPAMDAGLDAGTDAGGVDAASLLPTGTMGCTTGAECAEGVCWDFNDYDSFCFGRICSLLCGSDTDCQNAATAAGASNPSGARCGSDNKCDFVGAGLGAFACA